MPEERAERLNLGPPMHKRLLTSHVFSVEQRRYDQRDGDPVLRDVVVHPGAVVVLPIVDAHDIIMIRNIRYAVEQELWELPAGTREQGESPIETTRRELEEETGYRAGRIEPLMEFYTSPGFCTERMHAFVARELTEVGQDLQGDEQIVVERVGFDEARRKLIDGEFQDGKTIAVLGRYFLGLNRETAH